MLHSMTGFGKGRAENKSGMAKIEIKSLNCKFFEITSKLPPNLTIYEDKIRELLQKKVLRGRLTLFLSYDSKVSKGDEVHIDKKIAKQYYNRINTLKKFLDIKGSVGVSQIIALPGVIAYHPQEDDAKKLWPPICKALALAVEDLTHSRAREGRMLNKNILQIVKAIETSLTGKFQFIVRKDMTLTWPRAETPTHIITMGTDRNLTAATKIALREMLHYLTTEKGLAVIDAYPLMSIAVDLSITQLVDGRKGVHAMLPKAIFVANKN